MSSNRCRLSTGLLLVALLIGSGHDAYGRSLYHQPYLGLKQVAPLGNGPLSRFRAEQMLRDYSPDLGQLAKSSDLIFIGINGQPKKIELPDTRQVEYEADVRLYDFVKSTHHYRSLKFLRLRWKSSVTELGASERHLFFVRKSGVSDGKQTYQVLRAAFMTPDSRNKIHLFDHSNRFQTDLTIEVLGIRGGSALASDGFAERMAKTIPTKQMPLLTALPAELARPGWRQSLRRHIQSTSDFGRLTVVANDIITRGNDEDILALLNSADAVHFGSDGKFHPHINAVNRMAEFLIYDLFRYHGNDRIVRLLIRHGDAHAKKEKGNLLSWPPQAAAMVSAAFALAEIGGKDARQAIERWSKYEKLTNRTTLIATSMGQSIEVKYGELFAKALKRLDEKHAIDSDPPRSKR